MAQPSLHRVASLFALAGVALGAFGAHGLKAVLAENGTAQTWETAVFYHLVHALALFVVSGWPSIPRGPYCCFVAGIVLFSGSLYVLAVTGIKALGAVTPLGGVAFLAGWLWLALRR
ncbi:MAG: DUF423 domain-containing protein [Verrucomicrobiales bacterium]|nr:DUF423 domain-containing protein [Verrucomicrobiales bacterium]